MTREEIVGAKLKIAQLDCKRCRHAWIARSATVPKTCPKCHSPYWDREKRRTPPFHGSPKIKC